jgi:hypothetical protein
MYVCMYTCVRACMSNVSGYRHVSFCGNCVNWTWRNLAHASDQWLKLVLRVLQQRVLL